MSMQASNPIGVFDSGVGGLSVLHDIRRELPAENLLYVADSGHAPYGEKSQEFIVERSVAIAGFLISQNAKAIVVACNTATGAAVTTIRSRFHVPVVAMEPAIKPAAAGTQSGVIGVLATRRTLANSNFIRLFERYGLDVEILAQPCPGLVERVEAGDLSGTKTRHLLEAYVKPLLEKNADTLVLGCTHYPFLSAMIQEIAGPEVKIIDSSAAIARELRRRLTLHDLLANPDGSGSEQFWTSASPGLTGPVIEKLWRAGAAVNPLPEAVKILAQIEAL